MKAIVCTQYGPPEFLQLKDVETPTPARNEVRIKIFATAVTASGLTIDTLRSIRSAATHSATIEISVKY